MFWQLSLLRLCVLSAGRDDHSCQDDQWLRRASPHRAPVQSSGQQVLLLVITDFDVAAWVEWLLLTFIGLAWLYRDPSLCDIVGAWMTEWLGRPFAHWTAPTQSANQTGSFANWPDWQIGQNTYMNAHVHKCAHVCVRWVTARAWLFCLCSVFVLLWLLIFFINRCAWSVGLLCVVMCWVVLCCVGLWCWVNGHACVCAMHASVCLCAARDSLRTACKS